MPNALGAFLLLCIRKVSSVPSHFVGVSAHFFNQINQQPVVHKVIDLIAAIRTGLALIQTIRAAAAGTPDLAGFKYIPCFISNMLHERHCNIFLRPSRGSRRLVKTQYHHSHNNVHKHVLIVWLAIFRIDFLNINIYYVFETVKSGAVWKSSSAKLCSAAGLCANTIAYSLLRMLL